MNYPCFGTNKEPKEVPAIVVLTESFVVNDHPGASRRLVQSLDKHLDSNSVGLRRQVCTPTHAA